MGEVGLGITIHVYICFYSCRCEAKRGMRASPQVTVTHTTPSSATQGPPSLFLA